MSKVEIIFFVESKTAINKIAKQTITFNNILNVGGQASGHVLDTRYKKLYLTSASEKT